MVSFQSKSRSLAWFYALKSRGRELESPLDIARRIKALAAALPKADMPVPAFLAAHPDHALAVERVSIAGRYPFVEIRDNLIAQSCLPINMLGCKLSFFGHQNSIRNQIAGRASLCVTVRRWLDN